MLRTECVFFDGNSSRKKNTELIFSDRQFSFRVISDNEVINYKYNYDQIKIEYFPKLLQIRSVQNPNQFLQVTDEVFIREFQDTLKKQGRLHWYQHIMNLSSKSYIAITVALIGMIVGIYAYGIPWVAASAVYLLPTQFDQEIGDAYIDKFIDFYDVDENKSELVTEFWNATNHNEFDKINILVLDSDMANAFALPNGTVVIYSGLIDYVRTPSELAGVIAHEAAHIKMRHSLKKICRDLSAYIVISVIFNDVNGIMAIIGNNIDNLNSLSYSREYEREADKLAVNYLQNNRLQAYELGRFLKRISQSSMINIPEILSTHPDMNDRVNTIQELSDGKKAIIKKNNYLSDLLTQIKQQD